ncbi:hypothetical protein GCM10007919_56450 [Rhizobium indigoferae]|nr:hypothetical protein GCM10007919_56450 [Rhizobium indigoferae]
MAILETTTKLGPGLIAPTAKAAMMLTKMPAEDIGNLSFGLNERQSAAVASAAAMVVHPIYQLCRRRSRAFADGGSDRQSLMHIVLCRKRYPLSGAGAAVRTCLPPGCRPDRE